MKHMKRLLAALLALILALSLAVGAMALGLAEGTCGLHATWELSFTGGLSIGGSGNIQSYPEGIKKDFRKYNTKIVTVSMGSKITGVGAYAFQDMPALTTVTMGESVVTIDRYAFADCPVLTDVTFSQCINSIGANAFSNCTSLRKMVIPETVTSLGSGALKGCTGLQTVEIRNQNCSFSGSNVLPEGVTVIGYKGSTAQTYAQKNGLTFKTFDGTTVDPTTPSTQPTTESGACPLCGQTHEGFPGSLIGGIHSFIYTLLLLFGLRSAA